MEVYKRRQSDRRLSIMLFFKNCSVKMDLLVAETRPRLSWPAIILPFFSLLACPSMIGSHQPYHLPFQRWPWWKTRPIGSTFVIWQKSTGSVDQARLIFICVQSQDFNLVKGCGIYFSKHCPNSSFFSSAASLG